MNGEFKKNCFTKKETDDIKNRVEQIPVFNHLGASFCVLENGSVEVSLEKILPIHLGGIEGDYINGAILLGMVDCALVTPAMLHFNGALCATVDISIRFMKPVKPESFKVVGYVESIKKRLAYVKAKIVDKQNNTYVSARGVISLVNPK